MICFKGSEGTKGLKVKNLLLLTFLVLDLALHIVDGVRALHLQSNGLASQGLHKDLHASSQTQDQVKGGLLLDVIVSQSASILQLFAGKDQPLLVRGDSYIFR